MQAKQAGKRVSIELVVIDNENGRAAADASGQVHRRPAPAVQGLRPAVGPELARTKYHGASQLAAARSSTRRTPSLTKLIGSGTNCALLAAGSADARARVVQDSRIC